MEIKLPVLGENIDSATVAKIYVKAGDTIARDQPIVEIETEKASVDVPSSDAGVVTAIQVEQGDTVAVGQTLLVLEDGNAPANPPQAPPARKPAPVPASERPPEAKSEPEEKPPSRGRAAAATPMLRRMARELGVDIHAVKGTGPDNRITEDDVRNHARAIIAGSDGKEPPQRSASLPDFSHWGGIERKAMSLIRRKTAEHVHAAWTTIPHVTQFDAADIAELEKSRKAFSKKVQDAGGKLTLTAIAVKIVAAALKVFPQFNASLDAEREEIVLKKYCHIGVAVDTEHGLLVPVIRDADKKDILTLSVELTQLAEKARNKKLAIDDMQGGSLTVTNLGSIGGAHFTPIVNAPEVAILGISRASIQPVFMDGAFAPRLMLPLSLSYDHRVIDGADGARFLRWIVEAMEQPFTLLVG
jgi:pyruvate dehydrogenase E2 component (dihydrolipoamide acetyltransferase)